MRWIKVIGLSLMVISFTFICKAEQYSETVNITATIPQMTGLSIGISKVDADTGQWHPNQSSIDFGVLQFDDTYKIFRANCYYAVDVGVEANAASWTISHNAGPITDGKGHYLDDNISVTFVQQLGDQEKGADLGKYKYSNATRSFIKSQISPGWLRIYYGVATGNPDDPAEVITMSKPAGTYTGTITITLSTSQ